jgi:DNA mismatch repair protein PMS2
VENSLDAGATSIGTASLNLTSDCKYILINCAEIRFKNNGLDSIEVQDNGAGISPADFDTIGMLKSYIPATMRSTTDVCSLETLHLQALNL